MRILLAEDEVELSNALVAMLKRNNYSVDAVYDGEAALDYLRSENYDGVILDIMMPKLDGLSVLRTIRAEGNKVPALMLTAKSEIDDRVNGLDSGADDYLTKPFAMKELIARVRAITRRVSEASDTVLRYGDITLNCLNYELGGPKGSTRLANKEYQMLELLMRNANQVISGDLFFDRIWGLDSDAEQSVVWVNLSYIRKKLTSVGSLVSIKAVRGIGYMLEGNNG